MKSEPQILNRMAELRAQIVSERDYMKRLEEQNVPHDSDTWESHKAKVYQLQDMLLTLEWVLEK